jgi:hypothetical protein
VRSRLINLLGASIELGAHLVAYPDHWHIMLAGDYDAAGVARRLADAVGADVTDPVTGTGGSRARLGGAEAVAQLRGVGWAILYQDPAGGRLSNHWINLHEEGHPPGFTPLLVMDVWEHAFAGMNRSSYIAAFFKNLRWDCVEARGAGALGSRPRPPARAGSG